MVEYFFSTAALACNTCCPSLLTSELSSSKNSGRKGESRLRSSSDFDPIVSSAGIGGTGIGSLTGCGGPGGGGGTLPLVLAIGGGIGRATGGFALPLHAATTTVSSR